MARVAVNEVVDDAAMLARAQKEIERLRVLLKEARAANYSSSTGAGNAVGAGGQDGQGEALAVLQEQVAALRQQGEQLRQENLQLRQRLQQLQLQHMGPAAGNGSGGRGKKGSRGRRSGRRGGKSGRRMNAKYKFRPVP